MKTIRLALGYRLLALSNPRPTPAMKRADAGAARVALSADGIHVSPLDERTFKHLELPNGLQALVVSDAATESASAAMDVHVGFHSDPEALPGLAHFCEHMLFLGTRKFPDENSYSAFLSAHGGASNAFTTARNTNFYFDAAATDLRGALDRFAQFFIAPLFTASATDRELKAVDSENTNYVQDDYWRINQVSHGTSNPRHPFHKFGVGNLQTLQTTPQEQGIDVRAALLQFYNEYYSASVMKLVVYGKESVEELSEWVCELFAEVPTSGRLPPSFEGELPYLPDHLARRLEVVPVMDLKAVSVKWMLPSLRGTKYNQQHTSVLAHFIGHEGKGSLLSYLKRRKWANGITAGIEEEYDEFALFLITFEATDEGVAHADDILQMLFQYLQLLRVSSWEKWIFEELENLEIMRFLFQSKEPPINFTSVVAGNMQVYPKQDIISQGALFFPYDVESILELLDIMTPEKMKVLVVCKSVESEDMLQEPWYGAKYRDSALPPELLERCRSPEANESLFLPSPNAFVTSDYSLVAASGVNCAPERPPTLIRDDELCRVWHKTDYFFKKPRTHATVKFHSPAVNLSPYAFVLSDLFVACVQDELGEFAYDASLAGMHYDLAVQGKTIYLSAVGYSAKLPVLVRHVVNAMSSFADLLSEKTFERMKLVLRRAYENTLLEEAFRYAMPEGTRLLHESEWAQQELIVAIKNVTFPMLLTHCRRLFQQVYVEMLLYGNLDYNEALAFASDITDSICTPFTLPLFTPTKFYPPRQVILTPGIDHVYRLQHPNPDNANCAIDSIYQIGRENLLDRARLAVFAQIVQESLFNQLRTKEQLGYVVYSTPSRSRGVQFFRIIVQSSVASPEYLEQRICAFWATFRATLLEISPAQFAKYVKAVVKGYTEKPKNQGEEVSELMFEISMHEYVFDRKDRLSQLVQTLHLHDVVDFFDTYIQPGAPTRKKLSVQVYGNTSPVVQLEDNSRDGWTGIAPGDQAALVGAYCLNTHDSPLGSTKTVLIEDVHEFKRLTPLYDLPCAGSPVSSQ